VGEALERAPALAADVGAGDQVDHAALQAELLRRARRRRRSGRRGRAGLPQVLEGGLPAGEGGEAEEDVEAVDLERAGGARQVGGVEVEGVDVAAVEDDLREAALVGPGGGLAEHAGAEVDAEDAAFGADGGGEAVEALAGAAGQVEDRLAGARYAGRPQRRAAAHGRAARGCGRRTRRTSRTSPSPRV
jgi:hypothetical protein